MKVGKPPGPWQPESTCPFPTGPWTPWRKITDRPLRPQRPLCDITDHFLWGAILWLYQKTTLHGIYLPRCPACRWGHLLLIKLFVETECLQVNNLPKLTQHRGMSPAPAGTCSMPTSSTTSASAVGTKTAKIFF